MNRLIKNTPITTIRQSQSFYLKLMVWSPLFLFIFSVISSPAFAIESIYETCHWRSKSWTERLVSTINNKNRQNDTTAEAVCQRCPEISPNGQGLSALQNITDGLNATKNIPAECFLASSIKKYQQHGSYDRFYYCDRPDSPNIKGTMPVIDETGQARNLYPRSPCLSKDYTNMIKDSFHYMAGCFGFKKEELPYLFTLFNHESSFILNKKSGTGARCIGQLIRDTAKTINKYIYMSNDAALRPYYNIYKQALKKCPDLEIRLSFLPSKLLKDENPSFSKLRRIHQKMSVTCLTTQDPDICFFYSLYNMSVNRLRLRAGLKLSHENLPENLEIPQSMKDTFKLPVSLNEIVHIKGTVITETGEQKKIDVLLENDYEIYQKMSQYEYDSKELQIEKIPVYDFNRATEWTMLYLAYNGGMSVADTYLKEFLIKKKEQLSSRKTCKNRTTAACKARKKLLQGQSLELNLSTSETAQEVSDTIRKIRKLKWEIKKIQKTDASAKAAQVIEEKEKQTQELADGMENAVRLLRERTLGKSKPPELFSDYLLLEYNGSLWRRSEVIEFPGKIKTDAKDLHEIRASLIKAHKHSKQTPTDKEAENFLNSVKNNCQFPL